MSQPGQDRREVDDKISAKAGTDAIRRLIERKGNERNELLTKLAVVDGEIAALQHAQHEIEKLAAMKNTMRGKVQP